MEIRKWPIASIFTKEIIVSYYQTIKGSADIQDNAFEGCTVKTITIPSTVEAISETAFGEYHGLRALGAPCPEAIEVDPSSEHFKSIDGVLYSRDGKTLIKHPQAKVTEKYEILDDVTRISKYAFANIATLKAVTIPESVNVIDEVAFSKCISLESVSMPKNLDELGSAWFSLYKEPPFSSG